MGNKTSKSNVECSMLFPDKFNFELKNTNTHEGRIYRYYVTKKKQKLNNSIYSDTASFQLNVNGVNKTISLPITTKYFNLVSTPTGKVLQTETTADDDTNVALNTAYAFDIALDWSANRKQFGKAIGKFQGVSFKLADMAMEIKLANLIII